MRKFWKIVVILIGGVWAIMAVGATIPAHQAVSNLQSWADFLGLTALANLLAAKGVDYLTQGATILGAIFGGIQTWWLRQAQKRAEEDEKQIREFWKKFRRPEDNHPRV